MRGLKTIFWLLAVPALIWCCGLVWFLLLIPGRDADTTTKTDAIVVLTGGDLRLETGFKLLEQNLAPQLLISGVGREATLREILQAAGINKPAEDILQRIHLDRISTSTMQNAEEVSKWAIQHRIKHIRLVTAGYHMRRSLLEISARMPELKTIPHPVFPYTITLDTLTEEKKARFLILEYNKYLITYLRLRIEGQKFS